MNQIISHTMALCPVCKSKVTAKIVERDSAIYMDKFCKEHGSSSVMVSSDVKWYMDSMNYVKPSQKPLQFNREEFSNCPDSCGLCPEHQQHTCLPVIEINSSCDMDCPICLKDFQDTLHLEPEQFTNIIDVLIKSEGDVPVINLSGGEPTIHSHFREFVQIAYKKGVHQVTVSTNGLTLLKNPELRTFFRETGAIVALQFDGFSENTYTTLRGEKLLDKKLNLIHLLEDENVNYSLVSTIDPDVNLSEVTQIADFFFESKALTLMFQPITYTGMATKYKKQKTTITIPDVVKQIEKSKYVKGGDFNPLPCSHYSCFALSYYFKLDDKEFYSLKDFFGREGYLNLISNKTLPGLDRDGQEYIKTQLYELWSASDINSINERVLKKLKNVLRTMNDHGFDTKKALNLGMDNIKGIFIHHLMDVETLDFGRLMKCCNPYPMANGYLRPMCAQNIFYQNG